jgi:hypothetical protein
VSTVTGTVDTRPIVSIFVVLGRTDFNWLSTKVF